VPGATAFVVAEYTSHVGMTWSDGVAAALTDFAHAPEGASSKVSKP
jgi:hypothetical protein